MGSHVISSVKELSVILRGDKDEAERKRLLAAEEADEKWATEERQRNAVARAEREQRVAATRVRKKSEGKKERKKKKRKAGHRPLLPGADRALYEIARVAAMLETRSKAARRNIARARERLLSLAFPRMLERRLREFDSAKERLDGINREIDALIVDCEKAVTS